MSTVTLSACYAVARALLGYETYCTNFTYENSSTWGRSNSSMNTHIFSACLWDNGDSQSTCSWPIDAVCVHLF